MRWHVSPPPGRTLVPFRWVPKSALLAGQLGWPTEGMSIFEAIAANDVPLVALFVLT